MCQYFIHPYDPAKQQFKNTHIGRLNFELYTLFQSEDNLCLIYDALKIELAT